MTKSVGKFAICLGCLLLGYAFGWVSTRNDGIDAVQRVVAMSWGDGKYGKAFYGAEVYLVPTADRYSVRGRVWIGRGGGYFHDLGELGTVTQSEDAVVKWGKIEWSDAGLTIGPGAPNPVVIPRAKLESHR